MLLRCLQEPAGDLDDFIFSHQVPIGEGCSAFDLCAQALGLSEGEEEEREEMREEEHAAVGSNLHKPSNMADNLRVPRVPEPAFAAEVGLNFLTTPPGLIPMVRNADGEKVKAVKKKKQAAKVTTAASFRRHGSFSKKVIEAKAARESNLDYKHLPKDCWPQRPGAGRSPALTILAAQTMWLRLSIIFIKS